MFFIVSRKEKKRNFGGWTPTLGIKSAGSGHPNAPSATSLCTADLRTKSRARSHNVLKLLTILGRTDGPKDLLHLVIAQRRGWMKMFAQLADGGAPPPPPIYTLRQIRKSTRGKYNDVLLSAVEGAGPDERKGRFQGVGPRGPRCVESEGGGKP